MNVEPVNTVETPEVRRPRISALLRLTRWSCVLLAVYAGILLIGLLPVNNSFVPTPNGIEIFIGSSAIHADLVLPIRNETIDWREYFPAKHFQGQIHSATHVTVGWGDRGFYLNTPTWSDLTAGTAAKALLVPSATCMHVALTGRPKVGERVRSVTISPQQYARLVAFIRSSFALDADDRPISIDGFAYWDHDAFFEARGRYHCLNTCNSWIGRAMRTAGIRTPWLTPLPRTVFLYLPD